MARTELIKELEIRKKELYSEIKSKLPNLFEELNAIDRIIGSNIINNDTYSTLSSNVPTQGTPKGENSWVDYVLLMLEEIGGKGKSREVANAIDMANADIELKRAINASQDKLSKLLKEGKIKAIKPQHKKEGYIYEIL